MTHFYSKHEIIDITWSYYIILWYKVKQPPGYPVSVYNGKYKGHEHHTFQ